MRLDEDYREQVLGAMLNDETNERSRNIINMNGMPSNRQVVTDMAFNTASYKDTDITEDDPQTTDDYRDSQLRQFYSVLADSAYNREYQELPRGVTRADDYEAEYGDMAKVYRVKDDKMVIAYKGTDVTNMSDLVADGAIVTGTEKMNNKFTRAKSLFDKVRQHHPEHQITLTGHSLGGQLSQHVSHEKNKTFAYTFNAGAGPAQIVGARKSTNWTSGDDPISVLTQWQLKGRTVLNNPNPDRRYIPVGNLLERHGMGNFLPEGHASGKGLNPFVPSDDTNYDFLNIEIDNDTVPKRSPMTRWAYKNVNTAGKEIKDNVLTRAGEVAPEIASKTLAGAGMAGVTYLGQPQLAPLAGFVGGRIGTKVGEKFKDVVLGTPAATEGLYAGYNETNNVFNEYKPSVFNELNRQQKKPFRPYHSTFGLIDANKDNKITYSEFKSYYRSKGMAESDILQMFGRLDMDGDNTLTRSEFG